MLLNHRDEELTMLDLLYQELEDTDSDLTKKVYLEMAKFFKKYGAKTSKELKVEVEAKEKAEAEAKAKEKNAK